METGVGATGKQQVFSVWVPPHTVYTAIMGRLNCQLATTAVPDVHDFDAPACNQAGLAHGVVMQKQFSVVALVVYREPEMASCYNQAVAHADLSFDQLLSHAFKAQHTLYLKESWFQHGKCDNRLQLL